MADAGRPTTFAAIVGEVERGVTVARLADGRFAVRIDGHVRLVDAQRVGPAAWSLRVDGRAADVAVVGQDHRWLVAHRGRTHAVMLLDEAGRRRRAARGGPAATGARELRAVMPGKVLAVLVAVGDTVTVGQGVVVIEAMKMENEVSAPRAGVVQKLEVRPGQAVESGELLAVVE